MVAQKSVIGSLRRTAIHALGGQEKKPPAPVTHARVEYGPKPNFHRPRGDRPMGMGMGQQIKPSFLHRRERGGSGNRIQGLSDVAGSRQRDLRTRASNETSGMGQHLGKHTGHTQVIHATNAATANQPRTDHGGTDFLSSSGGNPAVPNHRPHNRQRGTHPIAPIDARAMVSQDGGLKLAKQHKS